LAAVCRQLEAEGEAVTWLSVFHAHWPDAAPATDPDEAPPAVVQPSQPAVPNVVFCTVSNRIIDLVHGSETPREAILRLTREYGMHLTVLGIDTAGDRQDAAFKSDPVRITEAQWWDALCVLPPEDWRRTAEGESFKMAERTSGLVTPTYVALDDGWFTFSDDCRMSHADCVARVRDWLAREAEQPDDVMPE